MVSSLNLTYIHLRLDEIYGGDEWFGGKTMLFVGDILQLPPVNGAPVFQNVPSKVLTLRIGCIGSANIWKSTVVYDELTINERQKGDKLKTYRRLVKPRVVNHPTYDTNKKEQEQDYYYCLILLFVPYTDESDLLDDGETPKMAFERWQNKGLLAHHDKLQKMLEARKRMRDIADARKSKGVDPPKKEEDDDDDDVLLKGMAKSNLDRHLELDQDVDPVTLDKRLSMLNDDQRRVYEKISSHLLHELDHENGACKCTNLKPLQMFVSGVGNSFLIQALFAFVKATWPD